MYEIKLTACVVISKSTVMNTLKCLFQDPTTTYHIRDTNVENYFFLIPSQ